jgi:hypothetical protein
LIDYKNAKIELMLYLTQMNIYNRITKQAQSPKLIIVIQISKKQGGKPMTFKFATDEWIKELSRQLNASEAYEKSASNWEGDFVFIIECGTDIAGFPSGEKMPNICTWITTVFLKSAHPPAPRVWWGWGGVD